MKKPKKPKRRPWDVVAFGMRGWYLARYAAGAVAQFGRQFGRRLAKRKLAIRTDPLTRGWKGVSVSLRPDPCSLTPDP